MMKTIGYPGLLLGVIVLLLSGCGGNNAGISGDLNREKTVILHQMSDPQGINPYTAIGANATYIKNLLFDKLVELDYETFKLRPNLATTLPEVSKDKLSYTFKLRPEAVFSDGKPVTAEDVLFSFKTCMNPEVDAAHKRAELHNFKNCVIVDERTVRFELSESGPFNLNRLAIHFYVIPKHIYDPQNLTDQYTALDATKADQDIKLVDSVAVYAMQRFANSFHDERHQRERGYILGSGRYVFDGWNTGQSIRLLKNKAYWDQSGHPFTRQGMDTIIFKTIPDVNTALVALKGQEIDFGDNFEPRQYQNEMNGKLFEKSLTKKTVEYPSYEYIGWSTRVKGKPTMFADKRVRQAMSHLVNVEEIIQIVMYGTATPLTSMVYKERPEYNNELKLIPYDAEKAKKLLSASGWKDTNSDGILDKYVEGTAVPFEFTLYYRKGNDIRLSIARQVQGKLKEMGIKMNIQGLDWNVMLRRLKRRELHAWIGAWVYDSDEQDLYSLFHTSQIFKDGYNWSSYTNPVADKIMERITTEWDEAIRFDLHRQIQAILHEDQPYTLLFSNNRRIAYSTRIAIENWYGQRPCFDPAQFYLSDGKQPD